MDNHLNDFYSSYKSKPIAIITHKHADIDAIVSAYLLQSFFDDAIILVPESMNYSATKLADKFHIQWHYFSDELIKDRYIVLVDTSSRFMVPVDHALAIFDHHNVNENTIRADYSFIYNTYTSSAEVLYDLFNNFSNEQMYLLGVAIISDTFRFKSSSLKTFEHFRDVLNLGFDYASLLVDAFPRKPDKEILQVLKGLSTVEYFYISKYIVAYSFVSAKEGEIASLLAESADIGFTINEIDDGCRISCKLSPYVDGIAHKIMYEVGRKGNGSGGGHSRAAGAFVKLDKNATLKLMKSVLEDFFK